MNKLSFAKLFATALLASSFTVSSQVAHAYITPGSPPPVPGAPGYGLYEGVAQLNQITRKGGGQWYRVSLLQPLSLSRLEISVLNASVKLHEVSVVTENRARVNIQALMNTPIVTAGQAIASENLYLNSRVILIDIRAESFGAYSDILVRALSQEGTPQLVVGDVAPQPQPPVRPSPQPPSYGGDLRGYCADHDHQQFYKAKQFAYSSQGVDLTEQDSVQWALNYNNTHNCGTIQEFIARFTPLRTIAYSSQGLDLTSQEAARFALNMAEYVSRAEAQEISQTIQAVRTFAYSTQGLDMTSQDAGMLARRWVESRCENASVVRQIHQQFIKEYNFAYSTSGLNMTSQDAIRYAAGRVAGMTRCGNLLVR
jgi:hypothetical protein